MYAFSINNICHSFGPAELKNISFSLPEGESLAIIGKVGSGKATLAKIIAGILPPTKGSVSLFDGAVSKESNEKIGYVYDGFPFADALTPGDIDTICGSLYQKWNSKAYNGYCFGFSVQKKKAIKTYSPMMVRKLLLSIAMSHATRLLIVNDAFSASSGCAIDDDIVRLIQEFLKKNKSRSLVVTSEDAKEVEPLVDHFLFLKEGYPVFAASKEDLQNRYLLVTCSIPDFNKLDPSIALFSNPRSESVSFLGDAALLPKEYKGKAPSIEEVEKLALGEVVK